jgi:hypothetical protein
MIGERLCNEIARTTGFQSAVDAFIIESGRFGGVV